MEAAIERCYPSSQPCRASESGTSSANRNLSHQQQTQVQQILDNARASGRNSSQTQSQIRLPTNLKN
jgi:hypothetical protein